jgi:hypothetical protein
MTNSMAVNSPTTTPYGSQFLELPLFFGTGGQISESYARIKMVNRPYLMDNADQCLLDAVSRYLKLNGVEVDFSLAYPLLWALKSTRGIVVSRITFYEDGAKIRIQYAQTNFIIDFDFEEPDSVFITTNKNGEMLIKDCAVSDLQKTLELF